ncbi:hypothetical protein Sulac_2835 [Sulfobacillus acidophilus DSM 10332]|uniref:Uncharacterized protein n=1 Tax=Sulfobacillus acidophilus (strain ATCC 700253 / DSM 10332 / NAL) TaxID=679936 RepID=G8TZ26_SULAD|nr:hypothetical protein Sulac_2835 [Sulfobacillus acidophilus DSM 10332]
MGDLSFVADITPVKEFTTQWKRAAALTALIGIGLALAGWVTGSRILWGLAMGILPGLVDLIGLGLRLPLWARLNPRAAIVGLNLRLVSRLVLLGGYFYVLSHYTHVALGWALAGIFLPHVVFLVWAAFNRTGKGVNG